MCVLVCVGGGGWGLGGVAWGGVHCEVSEDARELGDAAVPPFLLVVPPCFRLSSYVVSFEPAGSRYEIPPPSPNYARCVQLGPAPAPWPSFGR